MKAKILVVDDETSHRKMLEAVLSDEGYEIHQAGDGRQALERIQEQFYDLVLMDIRMGGIDGLEALKGIRRISPAIPVIMMTAYASVDSAVDALKSGAYDYLTKPLDIDELKIVVDKALRFHQLEQENRNLKERLDDRFDFGNIVGCSEAMRQIFKTLTLVAPSDATVLISGESGTGKELIANAIHHNSPRRKKPFVKVNCAALPETLLESELFGHEKGAFTGAQQRRKGRFQLAHTGSIFLDEIAEMIPSTQAKILRVLEEQEFEPLGSSVTEKVDVRVMAATNKDLESEIKSGGFREDLFFRINVVKVEIPPLRRRKEDIPILLDHFLEHHAEKNKKSIKGFTPKALDVMMRYDWPGNVRELENVVERSVVLVRGDRITHSDLPGSLIAAAADSHGGDVDLSPGRSLKEVEREMILSTLAQNRGNRTHAAKILGISRRTLQLKLKEYGIN